VIIIRFLRDFLGFTRTEMLVLALLCLVLVGGSAVRSYRQATAGAAPLDTTGLDFASSDSAFARGAALFDSLLQSPAQEKPAGTKKGGKLLPSRRVDINKATLGELMLLPGIGPHYAEAILTYRREQGPFTSVEQLTLVRGIGPKTMEKLRPYVKVE
jgi:comEA protein